MHIQQRPVYRLLFNMEMVIPVFLFCVLQALPAACKTGETRNGRTITVIPVNRSASLEVTSCQEVTIVIMENGNTARRYEIVMRPEPPINKYMLLVNQCMVGNCYIIRETEMTLDICADFRPLWIRLDDLYMKIGESCVLGEKQLTENPVMMKVQNVELHLMSKTPARWKYDSSVCQHNTITTTTTTTATTTTTLHTPQSSSKQSTTSTEANPVLMSDGATKHGTHSTGARVSHHVIILVLAIGVCQMA